MKFFWIIPFFLLQDTEAFLMKNAKVKRCLQASQMDENLLLEDCNPESDFQNWSWQGDFLMNHGTQSCLSVVVADRVQTSHCRSVGNMHWDCSDLLLSPLGSSQGYLVANRKGVALNNVRGLKAQWHDVADRSVCEEKAAKADEAGYFLAALTSTQMYDRTEVNATLALGIDQEELEELLWFFRTEDPSAWNYSVLALSFVAMILGLLLLAINIVRNRKRKIHEYREMVQTAQQAELQAKQALMYSPGELRKQEPMLQEQRSGGVMVQWKDGTITSLYTGSTEDAI
ncbi:organic solute transporter subunit beta [Phaenicophaeus curvirostris]|uniref:organic solute transporter subunit beta n=1 Tax=Phaenicophaeus curvirostris TaxID=33595 RepID=UPI0037F0E277